MQEGAVLQYKLAPSPCGEAFLGNFRETKKRVPLPLPSQQKPGLGLVRHGSVGRACKSMTLAGLLKCGLANNNFVFAICQYVAHWIDVDQVFGGYTCRWINGRLVRLPRSLCPELHFSIEPSPMRRSPRQDLAQHVDQVTGTQHPLFLSPDQLHMPCFSVLNAPPLQPLDAQMSHLVVLLSTPGRPLWRSSAVPHSCAPPHPPSALWPQTARIATT